MKIKNIIFDLGGVVIDLDRDKAVKALERLGVKDAAHFLGEYKQKGPFLELEKGNISSSDLYDLLIPQCSQGTRCNDIRDAFEEFLVGIPVERLRKIEDLRKCGFKLYVLSNTNPIMYNHWIEEAFRQDGKSINDYFDGIVVSFQERMCKPDPEIFQKVIDRYALNAEETLMLDDSESNLEGAATIGLKVAHITNDKDSTFESVCDNLLKQSLL